MDVGVIDVETCEPLPNYLVDLWVNIPSRSSGRIYLSDV
jgi:hypothetical protein